MSPRLTLALTVAVGAAAGAVLALVLRAAGPVEGITLGEALAAVGFGLVLAVAVLYPEAGLIMSLAYSASPLSFYILFRGTEPGSPYPPTSDLALDAAVTLGLAGAAAVGLALRAWGARQTLPAPPVRRPLLAIAAVLLVTAVIGLALGNPVRLVLADIVPFAELGLLAFLTLAVVTTRARALLLVRIVGISLAVTAVVRLVLYAQGTGAFGVETVVLEGSARPRLYQTYPYGWVLPFALACAIAARRMVDRVAALGMALLCVLMVLLSFERGVWAFAAIGTAAVVAFGVWKRPRMMAPVVAIALVALVLGAGLLGGGSGFTDPISLVRDRLAGTTDQLQRRQGIQHKRQDEASALWKRIRRDEAGWPIGHGLGAEYVGPTGINESSYATSFEKKHYSFNWYLAMVFRTGVVGLAVALWLVAAIGLMGYRAFRGNGPLLARGAGLGLLAGLAGLALLAPINPYLVAHPLAAFQGATLALMAFLVRPPARAAVEGEPAAGGAGGEAERIRRVYGAYDEDPRVQARRDPGNRANVLIDRERVDAVDAALAEVEVELGAVDVLDLGCGAGDELMRLVARGADPRRCHGVDLLPDRVEQARRRLPGVDVREADARALPHEDASMDIVVLKVVLSSVLDRQVTAQIAAEVDRVLRPGGVVVWYDNRYRNPFNRHVRGISRRELGRLFPGYEQRLRPVTVVPPLARQFGQAADRAYSALARIPLLRVRFAGVLVKGRGVGMDSQ